MDLFDIAVAKKLAGGGGGGGGASNVVLGTFKGTTNGVLSVSVPYTGEGYPISLLIYVKDGVDCSGTPFYDIVCSATLAQWYASKSDPSKAPTYPSSSPAFADGGDINTYRKTSSAHAFNTYAMRDVPWLVKQNPVDTNGTTTVKMWSATELKVLISDTGPGFYPNIEFAYIIVYSS